VIATIVDELKEWKDLVIRNHAVRNDIGGLFAPFLVGTGCPPLSLYCFTDG